MTSSVISQDGQQDSIWVFPKIYVDQEKAWGHKNTSGDTLKNTDAAKLTQIYCKDKLAISSKKT